MLEGVVIVAGLGSVAYVLYRLIFRSPEELQRRALRQAKLWPIGELPEGTCGRLVGTVRAIDRTLTAPLTGRACVWYRVSISAPGAVAEMSADVVLVREEQAERFALEDDSGVAIVDPAGAQLERRRRGVYDRDSNRRPSERERAILTAHGEQWEGALGPRSLSFHEMIVEVGETICVAGTGTREADPDAARGESDRPSPPKRLSLASSSQRPLLVLDAPLER